MAEVAEAFAIYHPDRIFNLDDTLWTFLDAAILALAAGGAGLRCHFSVGANDCLTAIATINSTGEKQPLWILAKGKTERSERRYANVTNAKDLHIDHSPNGWRDRGVASRYFRLLRERNGYMPIVVIWAVLNAHRDQEVKSLAKKLNARLIFIPADQTDEYGPLDRRIFDLIMSSSFEIALLMPGCPRRSSV
jgi:hypothetical protein